MKDETTIGSLLDKAEAYGETSVELIKLKALETSVQVASSLTIRIIISVIIFLVMLMLNITAGLWLGEYYHQLSAGFFIVSIFDALLLLVIYLLRKNKWVENKINNLILKQIYKK